MKTINSSAYMKNSTPLIGALLITFILLGCKSSNRHENNYNYESSYTKSTSEPEVDCYQLKEETLSYLKDNWDEIKDIFQRELERSENEETKNEITMSKIADMANGSIISSKLDKNQKKMEGSCPEVYKEYCQDASIFMLSHLNDNN